MDPHYVIKISINKVEKGVPEQTTRGNVKPSTDRVIEEVTSVVTKSNDLEHAVTKAKAILDLETPWKKEV